MILGLGLRNNLEISSAEDSRALAALCARRSIPPEEVMAFGDGGNDVEMLRWAFWSFAMENGYEEAKSPPAILPRPITWAGWVKWWNGMP